MDESVLELDPISCDGRGICAELFPEGIRLDSWGYPILRQGPVPPELLAQARWAVDNCPALALRLTRQRSAGRNRDGVRARSQK